MISKLELNGYYKSMKYGSYNPCKQKKESLGRLLLQLGVGLEYG